MIALGKQMSVLMRRELRQQGHYLTGKTSKDVQMQFEQTYDGYRLFLPSTPTINALEDGAVYKTGSKPPFQVILDWVKNRGLPRTQSGRISKAKGLVAAQSQTAWRIQNAIANGMPTRGSFAFSKNGERKGFISRSISESYIETQLNLRGLVEEILEINIRDIND